MFKFSRTPLAGVLLLLGAGLAHADAPPEAMPGYEPTVKQASKPVKPKAKESAPRFEDPTRAGEMLCNQPELLADATARSETAFSVLCQGKALSEADQLVSPVVRFSGQLGVQSNGPRKLTARYVGDGRTPWERASADGEAPADALAAGQMTDWIDTVAALPEFFSKRLYWDATGGVLSVEESPNDWRAFVREADTGAFLMAGVSDKPVIGDKGQRTIKLGSTFGDSTVTVKALLILEEGVLAVQPTATTKYNLDALNKALTHLDRKSSDIGRAWRAAALAQYLGRDAEVLYAQRAVATHHPHLLERFTTALSHIEAFSLK